MFDSGSAFPPLGASHAEALPNLCLSAGANKVSSKPGSPPLPCAVSKLLPAGVTAWPLLDYSGSNRNWRFADCCPSGGAVLLRNSVFHGGDRFDVRSVSGGAFESCPLSAVFISRTVGSLLEGCFRHCNALQTVAFEAGSHLCDIGPSGLFNCFTLRSIAIPSFVAFLDSSCLSFCKSLQSLMFDRPSRLATIERHAFSFCESLRRLCIPASVTTIDNSAFAGSGIGSIEIEEGSVSFRVENDLLVDFEARSLVWVIGSPDSIVIPSSIEELRPFCCSYKMGLSNVEFESASNLRSVGESAFHYCGSLKSICIPSSVEFLRTACFESCWNLQTVTFASQSKLRLIERGAFAYCESVKLVSVPASAEVIAQLPDPVARHS
jgi:hypothetical protein